MSERVKIYVSFDDDDNLSRGVEAARKLGGIQFLGVSTEPDTQKKFAVFESENDASRMMADVMQAGVKIKSAVVKGENFMRGLVPMIVHCSDCGKPMMYDTNFSQTGVHLCDPCLAKMIEGPTSKEGNDA